MASSSRNLKLLAAVVVVPYLIGCFISSRLLPENLLRDILTSAIESSVTGRSLQDNYPENGVNLKCERRLQKILGITGEEDPFAIDISLVIHRNGEAESCGQTDTSILKQLRKEYEVLTGDGDCPSFLDKYQVESLLTKAINNLVDTCLSTEPDGKKRAGLLGYCDMGPKKTPIMLDHDKLVPVSTGNNKKTLPCHFHTREGLRVNQLKQLVEIIKSVPQKRQQCQSDAADGTQACSATGNYTAGDNAARELHLYAVPAGRVFVFAPKFLGEIFRLPHVEGANEQTIYLEVLSLSPRVFDVFNFFSRDESQELVERAVAEKSESHKIKRSSTGAAGYNLNPHRTSESGFDTHGKVAVNVKK
jgi:hypothetical protein